MSEHASTSGTSANPTAEGAAAQPGAYRKYFTDDGFWSKLAQSAFKAGREVVQKALSLYYAAADPATPAWAKGVIAGALGYFILPIDAIPDMIPGVGFTDDLAVLAAAAVTVATHIKPEHLKMAEEKVNSLLARLPFVAPK